MGIEGRRCPLLAASDDQTCRSRACPQIRQRQQPQPTASTTDVFENRANCVNITASAGIAVLERIPLTPTGKPDRARLRKQLGASHAGKETIIHLKDLI